MSKEKILTSTESPIEGSKEKFDISELKLTATALSRVGLSIDSAYSDNQKIDGIDEFFGIAGSFLPLQGISLKKLGKELGDLTDEEVQEFSEFFAKEFQLPNLPNAELVIERIVKHAALTKLYIASSVEFGRYIGSVIKPKEVTEESPNS